MDKYPYFTLPNGARVGVRYVNNDGLGLFRTDEEKEQAMMLYSLDGAFNRAMVSKLCGRQFGTLAELSNLLRELAQEHGCDVQL